MSDLTPRGQTRVSDSVLDATALVAASGVQGVLTVEALTRGAAIGGAIGGTLGLVQAGPLGAALGASAGAAAGAAAGHALGSRQRRETFSTLEGGVASPDLHVAVTARYGEDLEALAGLVRAEIEAALRDALGLRPSLVTVEVVDVVSPEAEFGPDPYGPDR